MNKASYEKLRLGFIDSHMEFLESVQREIPSMRLHRTVHFMPRAMFTDKEHLSLEGAEEFTIMLRNRYLR